jgi:hypothetical protein
MVSYHRLFSDGSPLLTVIELDVYWIASLSLLIVLTVSISFMLRAIGFGRWYQLAATGMRTALIQLHRILLKPFSIISSRRLDMDSAIAFPIVAYMIIVS